MDFNHLGFAMHYFHKIKWHLKLNYCNELSWILGGKSGGNAFIAFISAVSQQGQEKLPARYRKCKCLSANKIGNFQKNSLERFWKKQRNNSCQKNAKKNGKKWALNSSLENLLAEFITFKFSAALNWFSNRKCCLQTTYQSISGGFPFKNQHFRSEFRWAFVSGPHSLQKPANYKIEAVWSSSEVKVFGLPQIKKIFEVV